VDYSLIDDSTVLVFVCRVANSINWARLVGQIVFHFSGYLDLVKRGAVTVGQQVDVCIPSGNFGNFMAAYYAKVCSPFTQTAMNVL